tara:strand:- start:2038 stop:3699 length:1662 start_codon:yes stop_codon:yes gene_type:complete
MKTIKLFNLDTSNLSSDGEIRKFSIIADKNAVFSLEITNEDSPKAYYNFTTKSFSTTKSGSGLNNIIIKKGKYENNITFPAVTDADHYDIKLWAVDTNDTKHSKYTEVRREDNTLDINASTGSNSNLLSKKIYQYINIVTTISLKDFGGATITPTAQTITRAPGLVGSEKISFSITGTVANDAGVQIIRQPAASDIFSYVTRQYGAAEEIPGEDLYEYTRTTSVTNGTGSGATDITLDDTCTALGLIVGDAVVLGSYTDKTLLITHTNPSGSNDNQIRVNSSISWSNDVAVTFYYKGYYRWNIHASSSLHGLENGMKIKGANGVTPFISLSDYRTTTEVTQYTETEVEREYTLTRSLTEDESLPREESTLIFEKLKYPAVYVNPGSTEYTNNDISKQLGIITHDTQQYAALANANFDVYVYGKDQIKKLTGCEPVFSNLKVELTELTTRNTSAVSDESVIVADRSGFINHVTRIKAIGIDVSGGSYPLVTAGGGNDGAGTLTIDSAQTIEDEQTITLLGTGSVVTVTGEVEFKTFPTAALTIYLDTARFLNIV